MFLGTYSLLLGHHCDRDLKPLEGSTYLGEKITLNCILTQALLIPAQGE